MPHIVLASGSPRRQELLRRIGITDFDIVIPRADETYPAGLTARETVAHIARNKAEAAKALTKPEDIVITAGIHYQLSRRTGRTRKELRKEAYNSIYGNTDSTSR